MRMIRVADVHLHGHAIAPRVQNGHNPVFSGVNVLLLSSDPHMRILFGFSPQFEFVGPSYVSVSVFHNLREEDVCGDKRIVVPLKTPHQRTTQDPKCTHRSAFALTFFGRP